MIVNKRDGGGGGGFERCSCHVCYIYEMATNASSCAIVIELEDQADQVGSANDFTCNVVPKKRKCYRIFYTETLKLQSFWGSAPDPDGGAYSAPPIPPSCGGRVRPSRHTQHPCPPPPPPPPLPNPGSATAPGKGGGVTRKGREIESPGKGGRITRKGSSLMLLR